jgi:hypothetical protein
VSLSLTEGRIDTMTTDHLRIELDELTKQIIRLTALPISERLIIRSLLLIARVQIESLADRYAERVRRGQC